MAGADDLARHLHELDRAFEVLNDEHKRAEYDRAIAVVRGNQDLNSEWTIESHVWQPLKATSGQETIQTSRDRAAWYDPSRFRISINQLHNLQS
jgi:curved DNA-binding protein CbpA